MWKRILRSKMLFKTGQQYGDVPKLCHALWRRIGAKPGGDPWVGCTPSRDQNLIH